MTLFVFCGLNKAQNQQALQDYLGKNDSIKYLGAQQSDLQLQTCAEQIVAETNDASATAYACIFQGELSTLANAANIYQHCHFIHFYSAPEFSCIDEEATKAWVGASNQLLDVHFSNLPRSTLFNQHQVFNNTQQWGDIFSRLFNVSLAHFSQTSESDFEELMTVLSCCIRIYSNQEVQALYEQLESASCSLNKAFEPSINARQQNYLTELQQLNALSQIKATKYSAQIEDVESSRNELKAENELALLQIHQLQEELEQTYLKERDTHQKLGEDNYQLKLAAEAKEGDLQGEVKRLESQMASLESERELALLQIHQLQEELEQAHHNASGVSQQANAESVKLQKNAEVKISELSTEVAKLAANKRELEAENELALLQIHQLQEELEFYYVKCQQGAVWTALKGVKPKIVPNHLQQSMTIMKLVH
ncbi:hypothetical protein M0C34_07290 [Agarivorans sp. TSD2052]|uniref:hypothetical protein n=1 Tax=Agarivorans sp. TSD2052 TaxID=2937286 RepID=UPI00200D29D2|nr:hypothetical protein [Agarivorans sp. TSD2052]UPW20058.1 hypothetical protein M0C34_07290 [Agarivorans sp. TSD2052]